MSAGLARIWWAIGLRGLATLLFGVAVLALLFATCIAANGTFAILTGARGWVSRALVAAHCRGHGEPRRGGRRARPVGAGRGPRGRRGQRPGNRDRRLDADGGPPGPPGGGSPALPGPPPRGGGGCPAPAGPPPA